MDALRARVRCFRRLILFVAVCVSSLPIVFVLLVLEKASLLLSKRFGALLMPLIIQMRTGIMRLMCRMLCAVCGIHIVLEDKDGSLARAKQRGTSSAPMLILANHICYLDVVAIGSLFSCGFLAKAEVRDWPVLGPLTAGLGCMYLDRDTLSSRAAALLRLRERLQVQSVCVFPEGTTTSRRSPCPYHWKLGQTWASDSSTAQWPGIRAISLQYTLHEEMVWVDDMAFFPHLLKVLSLPRVDIRLSTRVLSGSQVASLPVRQRSLSVCYEVGSLASFSV